MDLALLFVVLSCMAGNIVYVWLEMAGNIVYVWLEILCVYVWLGCNRKKKGKACLI